MNRRVSFFFCLLPTVLLFSVSLTEAQQPENVPKIGFLVGASASSVMARNEAFRRGLAELGYREGKDIVIEWRFADGKLDRLPELAAELVRLKVDVIVTAGSTATRHAKRATTSIPIVMSQDSDPLGEGFVTSLARPGGNITGLSNFTSELTGKRLELLKEIVPKLSRVAVLGDSANRITARELKEAEIAAKAFGMHVQFVELNGPNELERAFQDVRKGRADAILHLLNFALAGHRSQVANLVLKARLPAMFQVREYVEAGGLVSYATNITELRRRAATLWTKS